MIKELKIKYPINNVISVNETIKIEFDYYPKNEEEVDFVLTVEPGTSLSKDSDFNVTGVSKGTERVKITDSISGLYDYANVTVLEEDIELEEMLPEINENMIKGYAIERDK